jgi:aminotransferase in exopolysaccharide biosynthesis
MIPLSVPNLSGNEWKYVKQCLDDGWISSVGDFVDKFEHIIADYVGSKYAVACMNGTAGLHISLVISKITQNDCVIVPNITFIATLNAIKYVGATPILIDVDPNTWQMDLDLLDNYLSNNTYFIDQNCINKKNNKVIKAIMPVHVLGNICDIDKLLKIAKKYNLQIIEDSTESLGSKFNGKYAGTFGDFGVFSFNGNKIISTGGGGMIITDNKEYALKAKHLTTQAKSNKIEYIHDEIGYNYRLVNVLAAIGVAQMEQLDGILESKAKIDSFYRNELKDVGDIQFQKVNPNVSSNNWLFTFKTNKMRKLLDFLNSNGIISRPFWVPMNRLTMFQNEQYIFEQDNSAQLYTSCISIPCSSGISQEDLETVAKNIKIFYNK